MTTPYLSEIKLFSFTFAPKGWALCNGQLLPINQNQALFALLGTTYGGDGRVNFALPNLQGAVAVHMGSGFVLGQVGGENAHTLLPPEMPGHSHATNAFNIGTTGGTNTPTSGTQLSDTYTSQTPPQLPNLYSASTPGTSFDPKAVGASGGDQSHENRMPFLVLSYAIALQGIFPTQN